MMIDSDICDLREIRSLPNIPYFGQLRSALGPAWTYQRFARQLVDATRNNYPNPLELPSSIRLDPITNGMLNLMRFRHHQDGKERWTLLGIRNERSLAIAKNPIASKIPDRVSAEEMSELIKRASLEGITHIAANIHSHSVEYDFRIGQFVHTSFSAKDLWIAASYAPIGGISILADDHTNQLLKRTTETKKFLECNLNQQDFSQYWEKRFGINSEEILKYEGKKSIITQDFQTWAMIIAILNHYKLALYRGLPNQDLKRVYP